MATSDTFGAGTQQDLLPGGDGAKLYNWNLLNSAQATMCNVNIQSAGYLVIHQSGTSRPSNATFNTPFVYQTISGDFDITIGTNSTSYAFGFIARDTAASAGEDWVGILNAPGDQAYGESAVNNSSTSPATLSGVTAKYMRIVRVGNVFTPYSSFDGASWSTGTPITRNDYNASIQVGFCVWGDTAIDYFTIASGGLATTTTTLAADVNHAATGVTVTFTATVSGGSTPTGNMAFKDGASTLATVAIDGSYQAQYATSALAAGSHSMTAVYAGDGSNPGSTSNTVTEVINIVNAAVTLPHFTSDGYIQRTQNDAASTLPMFTISADMAHQSDAALILPLFDAAATLSSSEVGNTTDEVTKLGSIQLPMFTASGVGVSGNVAKANNSMPMFENEFQLGSSAANDLPMFTIDTNVYVGAAITSNDSLPSMTISAQALTGMVINGDSTIPMFILDNDYESGSINTAALSFPIMEFYGRMTSGNSGAANLNLPLFSSSGLSFPNITVDANLTLPRLTNQSVRTWAHG